jgi:hypothetical protein
MVIQEGALFVDLHIQPLPKGDTLIFPIPPSAPKAAVVRFNEYMQILSATVTTKDSL